jgi:hypothetical protein
MVRVAAGHQTLTVRYGLPWGRGLLFGLATGLAGMLLLWYLSRPMRKV